MTIALQHPLSNTGIPLTSTASLFQRVRAIMEKELAVVDAKQAILSGRTASKKQCDPNGAHRDIWEDTAVQICLGTEQL